MWISSLSAVNSTFPASMSARMASRPLVMAAASAAEMMPAAPSMAAWAMEPVMSSLVQPLVKADGGVEVVNQQASVSF